eukprot:3493132-Rhodomonas_salina.2
MKGRGEEVTANEGQETECTGRGQRTSTSLYLSTCAALLPTLSSDPALALHTRLHRFLARFLARSLVPSLLCPRSARQRTRQEEEEERLRRRRRRVSVRGAAQTGGSDRLHVPQEARGVTARTWALAFSVTLVVDSPGSVPTCLGPTRCSTACACTVLATRDVPVISRMLCISTDLPLVQYCTLIFYCLRGATCLAGSA